MYNHARMECNMINFDEEFGYLHPNFEDWTVEKYNKGEIE